MPTPKVLLTTEALTRLQVSLRKRKFQRMGSSDPTPRPVQGELFTPVQRRGKKAGFSYTANRLTVIVWVPIEGGLGSVLIVKNSTRLYSRRISPRKDGFAHNLLGFAEAARLRVDGRPQCPRCGHYMIIRRRSSVRRGYYWGCKVHPKETASWDRDLPQEAIDFLKIARK